jgi:hypothetical protein
MSLRKLARDISGWLRKRQTRSAQASNSVSWVTPRLRTIGS